MHILIVKLSAIGDVIHTLPALNALRAAYPGAHITWLVETAAADLIKGHKALNEVLVCDRKGWLRAWRAGPGRAVLRAIGAFTQRLRQQKYDILFDFQAALKGSLWIALARARQKVGFDRGMVHQEHSYLFLNRRLPPVSVNRHAIAINLDMLRGYGIAASPIRYDLPLTPDNHQQARLLIESTGGAFAGPVICVNPMARWESKLWPEARFSRLADALSQRYHVPVFFTGAATDIPVIESIQRQQNQKSVNLAGRTSLKTLAALYAGSDLLISTDTGPMHLAAAVGTPVVALFGPTAPWRTGPLGNAHQVIRVPLACSPCFKRHCPDCMCMHRIEVSDVIDAVANVLGTD